MTDYFSGESGPIQIGDLLQNRADPNTKAKDEETPLSLAVGLGHHNLMNPLIQYGADVNYQHSFGMSILQKAILFKTHEAIKILCKAGALLTSVDDTVFHILVESKNEEFIKTVITYGHVDFEKEPSVKTISCGLYGQEVVPIVQTIKGALLAFNRLSYPLKSELDEKNFIRFPIIPHEVQLYILSKLFAQNYFHWGLYKELMPRYKPCPFFLLNSHVECFLQILQMKNKRDETATLQLLREQNSPEYLNIVLPLFNGSRLRHDLDEFKRLYGTALIPEANLVLKIYKNHYYNFQKKEKMCEKSLRKK